MFRRRPKKGAVARPAGRPATPAAAQPSTGPGPSPQPAAFGRGSWFSFRTHDHLDAIRSSFARLAESPLASLMTAVAIAIALALPVTLYVAVMNLQQISAGWDNSAQISLFLKKETAAAELPALVGQLQGMQQVVAVKVVTPDEALQEFRNLSGLDEAVDVLDTNPFPAVLLVMPHAMYSTPQAIEPLLVRMRALPQVETAQLDMDWLRRWQAAMDIGQRTVWLLGGLLGLGVMFVVGNTIRLLVQNHRDEIEVQKLIGATDRYIRRPFLYTGCWYGMSGALIAWLVVYVALAFLKEPVSQFVQLYGGDYRLEMLDLQGGLALLLDGGALGLLGARLAVGRHLSDIEPT
ncbi:MAG: cell division protein [Gammaproteobacteria bacterium]|nr:cell division protein [Gammaproteobacteria bacterium]